METITLNKQEAKDIIWKAPLQFRFAKAADFHNDGIRKDYVQIFILQSSSSSKLVEYIFGKLTSRNWLQWLLINKRVFIRDGDRPGKVQALNYFIIPTEEFLINEINRGRA